MGQCLRDAVDERLAADEAMIGQQVGTVSKMLTAAEANLQVQRLILSEQPLRRNLAIGRNRDGRQKRIDQLGLPLAQLVPARPAVQPVECRRIAGFVRGHGRRA